MATFKGNGREDKRVYIIKIVGVPQPKTAVAETSWAAIDQLFYQYMDVQADRTKYKAFKGK